MKEIRDDLQSDYGDRTGWVCVAWKDRAQEAHFSQKFFRWPQEREEVIQHIYDRNAEGCCVWKPTALLKHDRRAETIPTRVLSFEVDQPLSSEAKKLLGKVNPTILKSGRDKHYHIKVYLDRALEHGENAYWTKYLASALGITGRADSGGKFNPHDLLRIEGTTNTKPGVRKRVEAIRHATKDVPFRRLKDLLSDYPAPNESTLTLDSIVREDIPEDRIPERVRAKLREPAGEDRSEQTYAFVQLCREEGLSPGYTLDLAHYHPPTMERNNFDEDRITRDVIRCWNKGDRTSHEVEDSIFCTPELQFLHREAKMRKVSPMSALGLALIHAGIATPPWVMIPPVSGGSGAPVNLILANVGPSGAGKGISSSPILTIPGGYRITGQGEEEIMYQSFADASEIVAPSSGPAFAAMFVQSQKILDSEGKPTGKDEIAQYAYARHVHWGEVDTLNTYLSDKRDTVSPELRSGWSGESLGSTTKARESRIKTARNSYRLMVSFDAQPERCGDLFAQLAGGLLSRVVFLNAWDRDRWKGVGPRTPETRQMTLPKKWPEAFEVKPDVWAIVEEEADSGKYVGTEDSHRNLNRLKIAALLAVMHGSTVVEMGWWDIAGGVLEHSDQVKREIRQSLKEADRSLQRSLGVKVAAREVARDAAKGTLMVRAKERILSLLEDNGAMTKGKLRQRLSRYQQTVFYDALEELKDENLVSVSGTKYKKNGA